jgi:ceramide glucosyltransferase
LNAILAALALLSLALTLWQWFAAQRFSRAAQCVPPLLPRGGKGNDRAGETQYAALMPAVTLLKPLKGCDESTEACLRSWFTQVYPAPIQLLFGVASADDPVVPIVRKLQQEFAGSEAQLVVCGLLLGANAKVSQLAQLEPLVKHDILVISDADVRVPPDLLVHLVASLSPSVSPPGTPHATRTTPAPGLACCFYRLANPSTLAMQWEAIAINADFWSQVLQAQSLKPIDFALGAVMALPISRLEEIGGFNALADCLADDYQLGNRIARQGHPIALCSVVVDCWSEAMDWAAVWKHQLRWARTIRVCQPLPYFFSVLSNATLWPLVWIILKPGGLAFGAAVLCELIRVLSALDLQTRLDRMASMGGRASSRAQTAPQFRAREDARPPVAYAWLVPIKDLLQALIWGLAFLGNRIEWRGRKMRLRSDGTLEPPASTS